MRLFQDDLILRLPERLREELLKVDGAKIFSPMPGRPMREYVAVPPLIRANHKELASWVSRTLEHGESLKPKSRTSKPKNAMTNAHRHCPSHKTSEGSTCSF